MSSDNPIRFGHALPGAGMPPQAADYDYMPIIGRRATLKPCGENMNFDVSLPRQGVLTRQLALTDWGSDWLVMTFDTPLRYDGVTTPYCLIRARWLGCPVGSEFCPVFVLTDPARVLAKKKRWASKEFQFISWAEVDLIVAQEKQPSRRALRAAHRKRPAKTP